MKRLKYLETVAAEHFPGDSFVINYMSGLGDDISTTRRNLNLMERAGLITHEEVRVSTAKYKRWMITDEGRRLLGLVPEWAEVTALHNDDRPTASGDAWNDSTGPGGSDHTANG